MKGEYLKIETVKELEQLKEENKILRKNVEVFESRIKKASKYIKSNSNSILVMGTHNKIKTTFNKEADPNKLLNILQ